MPTTTKTKELKETGSRRVVSNSRGTSNNMDASINRDHNNSLDSWNVDGSNNIGNS
jgi:hypothetical protein